VKARVLLRQVTVGTRLRTTTTTIDKINSEVNEPKFSDGGKDALEMQAARTRATGVRTACDWT
jgi:hypothetical protein